MKALSVLPRYLLAGAANTLASYLVYLALLQFASYRVAYVVSFVAGMAGSFLLLRFAVFRVRGKRHSWAYVVASHMLQLVLGLVVVEAWVAWLQAPKALAALAAVAVCVPVMFVVHRWVFADTAMAERG